MAETTTGSEQQLVVFTLSEESYGVDIGVVEEIIRMQHITRVPRAPEYVVGVTNLRGRVIPVIDLRHRFGLSREDDTAATRIVVVEIGRHTIGMVVDGVSEVLRISESSVELPSSVVTTVDSDYLRGIAKIEERLVILLDLEKILAGTLAELSEEAA